MRRSRPKNALDHLRPGRRLRFQRTRIGLTQAAMARVLGLSAIALSRMERGVADVPMTIWLRVDEMQDSP